MATQTAGTRSADGGSVEFQTEEQLRLAARLHDVAEQDRATADHLEAARENGDAFGVSPQAGQLREAWNRAAAARQEEHRTLAVQSDVLAKDVRDAGKLYGSAEDENENTLVEEVPWIP